MVETDNSGGLPPFPYKQEKRTETRRASSVVEVLKNEHYFRSPFRKEVDIEWIGQLVEAYVLLNVYPFMGSIGKVKKVIVNGEEAELKEDGQGALRAYCTGQLKHGANVIEVHFNQNPVPFLPSGWGRWQLVAIYEYTVEYEVPVYPSEEEKAKWEAEVRQKTIPKITSLEFDYYPKKDIYKSGEIITLYYKFKVDVPDPEHTQVLNLPKIHPSVTIFQHWAEVIETEGKPLDITPPIHSQTQWVFDANPTGWNEGTMKLRLWGPLRGTRDVQIVLSYFFPYLYERAGYPAWQEYVRDSHELHVKVEGPVKTLADVEVENLNLKWGDSVKITVKNPRFIFADGTILDAKFDVGAFWIETGPHIKVLNMKFSDDFRTLTLESPPIRWSAGDIEPRQNERLDDFVKIKGVIYQGPVREEREWHALNVWEEFRQEINLAIYRSDVWPGELPAWQTWCDLDESSYVISAGGLEGGGEVAADVGEVHTSMAAKVAGLLKLLNKEIAYGIRVWHILAALGVLYLLLT